jgi:hypothetical protein
MQVNSILGVTAKHDISDHSSASIQLTPWHNSSVLDAKTVRIGSLHSSASSQRITRRHISRRHASPSQYNALLGVTSKHGSSPHGIARHFSAPLHSMPLLGVITMSCHNQGISLLGVIAAHYISRRQLTPLRRIPFSRRHHSTLHFISRRQHIALPAMPYLGVTSAHRHGTSRHFSTPRQYAPLLGDTSLQYYANQYSASWQIIASSHHFSASIQFIPNLGVSLPW